eukprot:COSAG06_NODE_6205_length_3050_cov_2.403592_3_plen_282_part_00
MPYHVERRRDLSDAKKCISAAESREQAHAKGTLGRASRGVRKGRKLATSKGRRRQVAVVWDEETQTYRWPHDDEESSSTTGAPKAPRQPADQGQTIVSARQDATESHPGQMDTIGIADSGTLNVDGVDDDDDDEEVATADGQDDNEGGSGSAMVGGGGGGGGASGLMKLRAAVGADHRQSPAAATVGVGDRIAKTVAAMVSQVRQRQLARQQQRLATLRAAAAAAQEKAEATVRVQTMMTAVCSGRIEVLQRLGLGTLHDGDLRPEQETPAAAEDGQTASA